MKRMVTICSMAAWLLVLVACSDLGAATGSKRALVVGIDVYRGPDADPEIVQRRRLSNLAGAVRDARSVADLLEGRGFEVRTLINGEATRAAIVDAWGSHLHKPARPGDELVFYFAGHGSRARSADPQELDGLDETLVPVDAAAGGSDLIDDDLHRHIENTTAEGARLTVILDACFSGAASRTGLLGAGAVRGADGDVGPVERSSPDSSSPAAATFWEKEQEHDGALFLAAARAHQQAREIYDAEQKARGVFTSALLRALQTSPPWESAAQLMKRTQARIVADGQDQRPMLAGNPERWREPLFSDAGAPKTRGRSAPSAEVLGIGHDEPPALRPVYLEGGLDRGFRVGDLLTHRDVRARLEEVDLVRSRGRLLGSALPSVGTVLTRFETGELDEPDLRVFMPESPFSARELVAFHRRVLGALSQNLSQRSIRIVDEPWADQPTHIVYYQPGEGWLLVGLQADSRYRLASRPEDDELSQVLNRLPAHAAVSVELPLPHGSIHALPLGADRRHDGVHLTERPEGALYQLMGKVQGDVLRFSWVLTTATAADSGSSLGLPTHTQPISFGDVEWAGRRLTEQALKLAQIRFWLKVESLETGHFPYQLALAQDPDGAARLPTSEPLAVRPGERYGFALASAQSPSTSVLPRYLYLLGITASGERKLIFPHPTRPTENLFPQPETPTESLAWIPFGPQPMLRIKLPAGIDTYILLATEEPILDPSVLDAGGVRAPRDDDHPLACLILSNQLGRRGDYTLSTLWSIHRLTVEVIAPRAPTQPHGTVGSRDGVNSSKLKVPTEKQHHDSAGP